MPFDTSMYRNQPTNVLDVIGGYQNLALNRQRKQMNALAMQQDAQAMQEKQRAQEEMAQVRNLLAGAGGSREDAIKALETRGYYKPADELRKAAAEDAYKTAQTEHVRSQMKKEEAETTSKQNEALGKRLTQYKDFLAMVKTPQDAATWISAQYNDPITKDFVSRIPMDKMLQSIPQDQDVFDAWRNETGMGIEKFVQNRTTQRGQDIQAETSRANNADTNARVAAEGAANRAVTRRGQDLVDARQRDLNTITKEEKEAQRIKEKTDSAVTKYSDTLQKNEIPAFENALQTMEAEFAKYKEGSAPGVGRGAGLLPDWIQGTEAESLRNAIAAVQNIQIKARSGSAVSGSELARNVQELGTGGFRDEATLRKAMQRVRDTFEKVKANTAAGVTDDVKNEYEARGGVKITRGGNSFKDEAEVEAAFRAGRIKKGDTVIVNGRKAVWE